MDRFDSFTLAPLSAGDIIDRAVRIYRRQFLALLQIVAWPSLIAYSGVIAYTFGVQNLSLTRGDARIALSVGLIAGGFLVMVTGKVAFYVVLGGTSRSLVNYFLDGTPLRPREVYRAVRERFWSLVGATLMVALIMVAAIFFLYMVLAIAVVVYMLGAAWLVSGLPFWLQVVVHSVFGLVVAGGLLLLGLLIFKRIVFIPQALMVEGKGVFSAISRSFALAGRDVRQIGAIVLFDSWLTFSLLFLLAAPLGWYAWVRGVSLFGADKPIWYEIAYQTLSQVSEILLAPIAMLGFTLLYIDSRVRREGFDIELLASRQLAPAPPIPQTVQLPVVRPEPPGKPAHSILGLDDYRPRSPDPPGIIPPAAVTPPLIETGAGTSIGAGAGTRACQECGNTSFVSDYDRFCQICGTPFGEKNGNEAGEAGVSGAAREVAEETESPNLV